MAIAGLHNISVFDSSFLRESQSEAVRGRGDDGRQSTRASSLLQMWRELEDEHEVSPGQGRGSERLLQHRGDGLSADLSTVDGSDNHCNEQSVASEDVSATESDYGHWSPSRIGSESGQDDSSDLGGVERERVRQIFQEWMNSGARDHVSNISRRNNGSRAEWLGENEQERVRIIRQRVQMNSWQRGASVGHDEGQDTEVVGPIDHVLDRLVINHNESQAEHTRRGHRRLCGRQALLDMLKKAEQERQRELQGLLEHRVVSQFAHRNRIQSLLRGRFLRNGIIEDKRPTSTTASELGFLRQRHTVSDLREGFFSRLDHSVCSQVGSNTSDTSSNADSNGYRSEITSNSQQAQDEFNEQTESNIEESNGHKLSECSTRMEGIAIIEDTSHQESNAYLEGDSWQNSENEVSDRQQSANSEFVERRDDTGQEVDGNRQEGTNEESSLQTMETEIVEHYPWPSTTEVFSEQSVPSSAENIIPILSNDIDHFEGEMIEGRDWQDPVVQVEQWQNQVLEHEERSSFQESLESNEWTDGNQDNIDGHQHETVANEWLENENREEASEAQHEGGGFQEAAQNWLGEPPDQEVIPVGRMNPIHFPDDDNVYSMELRELLSRRSVSTLLHSGFRESLDQLVRSYVERQSQAPLDWELEETFPTSASAQQELEQQNRNQNEDQDDDIESLPPLIPQPVHPVRQLWGQDSHHYGWPQHDMHQCFGFEWDIINDLRIDMARLQQRMNNMQTMLEACMDMQLELQRSIRQEVSAALNRSGASAEMPENSLADDRSKWDNVRKGLCCICCESGINSLLYRCGHMCTCSKCANELVKSGEKCPMCRAPVTEVIRAYSIS